MCQSSFPIHPYLKVKLSMTSQPPKAPPLYPKTHLLAASGIAALLSLALLVFPSSEVEAKRTTLNLELETPAEQLTQEQDASELVQATNEANPSPFAQIEQQDSAPVATATVEPEAAPAPSHREVIVSKGDTLSPCLRKSACPRPPSTKYWLATNKPSSSASSNTARNSSLK
jgi:hypothetical protein